MDNSPRSSFTVSWTGPYSLRSFVTDPSMRQRFHVPGVYLWIREHAGNRVVSYIGRASGHPSLWQRHQQHYAFMIGGLYQVPAAYRTVAKDWVPDWTRTDVADILSDREKFCSLISECFSYAERCSVYLAPMSADNVKAIERNLLYDLNPIDTTWGTMSEPNPRLIIQHESPVWLTETMHSQFRVPLHVA